MRQNKCEEKKEIIFPKISINNGFNSNELKNEMNLNSESEIKFFNSSFPISNSPFNDLIKGNPISDYFFKDTLNENLLNQKTKNKENKEEFKREENKYPLDNLLRRAKRIALDSIRKYDNIIIDELYNHNLGNGVNKKKLLKNDHSQIKCTGTLFNKALLKKTQGEIFSKNITTKYSYYPLDHNKQLIHKLLNEKDEIKRDKFNKIFNKTLCDCMEHIIGNKNFEELARLEKIYEEKMIELNEEEEYKDELRKIFNNYQKIFNNKKPRMKKMKK
jgi:hypothetical protein